MKESEFGKRSTEEQKIEKLISELKKYQPETNMLREIVPMCSFCKKIRDYKGYWYQADTSAAQYSEIKFSHSVCPKCRDLHYPKHNNNK